MCKVVEKIDMTDIELLNLCLITKVEVIIKNSQQLFILPDFCVLEYIEITGLDLEQQHELFLLFRHFVAFTFLKLL